MKKIILVSTAVLALLPALAHAQDSEAMFSGPKLGIEVGRGRLSVRNDPGAIGANPREARNGISYRGFAGYDVQIDRFVIGAEAGVEGGGRTVTQRGRTANYAVDPGLSYDLSARAGVAVIPNVLLYGRMGYRWLQTDRVTTPLVGASVRRDRVEQGVSYGAGAEFAIDRHFSLRAEYNRTPLSKDVRQNRFLMGATMRF